MLDKNIKKLLSTANPPAWKFWISNTKKKKAASELSKLKTLKDLKNPVEMNGIAKIFVKFPKESKSAIPVLTKWIRKYPVFGALNGLGGINVPKDVQTAEKFACEVLRGYSAEALGAMGVDASSALPDLKRALSKETDSSVKFSIKLAIKEIEH